MTIDWVQKVIIVLLLSSPTISCNDIRMDLVDLQLDPDITDAQISFPSSQTVMRT